MHKIYLHEKSWKDQDGFSTFIYQKFELLSTVLGLLRQYQNSLHASLLVSVSREKSPNSCLFCFETATPKLYLPLYRVISPSYHAVPTQIVAVTHFHWIKWCFICKDVNKALFVHERSLFFSAKGMISSFWYNCPINCMKRNFALPQLRQITLAGEFESLEGCLQFTSSAGRRICVI